MPTSRQTPRPASPNARENVLRRYLKLHPRASDDDAVAHLRTVHPGRGASYYALRHIRWARNRLADAPARARPAAGNHAKAVSPDGHTVSDWAPRSQSAASTVGLASFAHHMEQRALELGHLMCRVRPDLAHLYADGRNMQPWYSAPCLFEQAADRVFLALNPGGVPRSTNRPYRPHGHDCAAAGCETGPFNRWLDEEWEGHPAGRKKNQVAVLKAFRALFGDCDAVPTLRRTPCFEVCPLRTHQASDLPKEVWLACTYWCREVLEKLAPRTIFCNGNNEKRNSAWAAIRQRYDLGEVQCRSLYNTASLKWGKIGGPSGALTGAVVIGCPHLSQFDGGVVFDALRDLRHELTPR